MKLATILDTYPSASETFIAREIAALRRRGFEIEIFALTAGEGAHRIERFPARACTISAARAWRAWGGRAAYFSSLGHGLAGHPAMAGVAHVHAGFASHPAFIAWGAAAALGVPWSFSGHARDIFVEGAALGDKLRAARFAAICTRAGERFLREQWPDAGAKILYAPHGLDVAQFPFRAWTPPNGLARLLGVGRLVEKKGFAVLLDALALWQRAGRAFHATIIGDGPLRDALEQQRDALGLAESVTFSGAQSQDAVRAAMAQADAFVLPCIIAHDGDRDGLPNVLLEAAACGLPLVSTPVGGVGDFLDDTTGRLCPPHDPAALSAMLSQVFAEPERTCALCHAARRRVETEFDIERNVERLAAAFRGGLLESSIVEPD